MTMKERISAAVAEELRWAADGVRKDEIVEELSGNLYAKYDDLVKGGADPEEAYGQAMESLGDVTELIDLCGGTKARAEFDAAVDSLTDLGRSAVDGMKDVWHGVKEPLKDVGRSLRDAMKSLEITVTTHDRHQFDYSVPAAEVTGLEFRLRSGDVSVHIWDQDCIQVIERSGRELDENKHANFFRREDGVLCVEQGYTAVGLASLRFGLFSSDFEVFLPQRLWKSLTVYSTNGDVTLEDPMEVENILVSSTNGDVALGEGLVCRALTVTTVNGDVTGRACTLRAVTLKGTSGDLDLGLAALPEAMEVSTASGSVRMVFPENDGFAVAYDQMSGDFNAAFEMTTSLNRQSGVASYKAAQTPLYRISTLSGDIDLELE